MNGVNKTLFIPLFGKAMISRKGIILKDKKAEDIWEKEGFPIKGKMKSRWLAYNMAMRSRIFDDWTTKMLRDNPKATVLHIGCGLDSRCVRVKENYSEWIDADFPEVIETRKKYFQETETYHMIGMDASKEKEVEKLPENACAIVILEGISMYLTNEEKKMLLSILRNKYTDAHILMDVYTEFAAKISKYKNPVNGVGVTTVYGIDDIDGLVKEIGLVVKAEHSLTPIHLVNELGGFERVFFKCMFTGRFPKKIYRLFELEKSITQLKIYQRKSWQCGQTYKDAAEADIKRKETEYEKAIPDWRNNGLLLHRLLYFAAAHCRIYKQISFVEFNRTHSICIFSE